MARSNNPTPAIQRVITILQCLSQSEIGLAVSGLSRLLEIGKGMVLRLLDTLEKARHVTNDAGCRYDVMLQNQSISSASRHRTGTAYNIRAQQYGLKEAIVWTFFGATSRETHRCVTAKKE